MDDHYRVILSPRAFADLESILDYIRQDSPQNAAKMVDRLWESAQSLGEFPRRHRVVETRQRARRETRMMPDPPYLIYYQILEREKVVRILTVRHGARRRHSDAPQGGQ